MRSILLKICLFMMSCLVMTGCATPTPAEICSTEWISQRTDRAMAEFERDVRPMMRTFRRAARATENGNVGALLSIRLIDAVTKMGERLESSQALQDVRLVGETCNDPDLWLTTLSGFMSDQGAPQQVIDMLELARGFTPSELD